MIPRFRASPMHGGAKRFLEISVIYSQWGRPVWGGGGKNPWVRQSLLTDFYRALL
jgi:hypothetical protein